MTTQFPHTAQNLDKTTAGQQQTVDLLSAKTTHSLPKILPEVEGRWVGEGEGLTPKKYQIMATQYNVIYTELALS